MITTEGVRITVVVIGYAPADVLKRCLSELRAQAQPRSDTEVLVVAHPEHQGGSLGAVNAEFREFTWIAVPPSYNVARMRGLGIARCRGAVVALLEGDCVPARDWLTRVAEMSPVSAVGGAVEPGAFRRGVDWGAYFCEFAKFMLPLPTSVEHLPGANVVYRRDRLPDPARLEAEGFYETFVNAGLRDAGPLAFDSSLVVRHERTWRAGVVLATRFHHGRGFASLRVRERSAVSRLPFLALSMLLPFVLVARVLREPLRRSRLVGRALLTLPWIIALSLSWSAGEFMGYLAGPGTSLARWR